MTMSASQLAELREVLRRFEERLPSVEAAGRAMAECLKVGGKLLTCGNGGSATDAMHLAEELTGRYKEDRRALAAICLNADPSALTCIGNDFGFGALFSRQVEALGHPGDILVGFSTSGGSENVLRAFDTAAERGLRTVLVGGKDGGKAAGRCDFEVIVPSDSTARIQETHTFVLHQWLEMIEAEVVGNA